MQLKIIVFLCLLMGVLTQLPCLGQTRIMPPPETAMPGFTPGTHVYIVLEVEMLDRWDWFFSHSDWSSLLSTVFISGGHGEPGADNKIMIYGNRLAPMYQYEVEWYMTPEPRNLYFTETQTTENYSLPFGPTLQVLPDPDPHEWSQYYYYTACLWKTDGNSSAGSALLEVCDGD